jgi:hypothetical protein
VRPGSRLRKERILSRRPDFGGTWVQVSMEGYSDMLRECGVPWLVRRLLEESAAPCTMDIEMTGELKMRLQPRGLSSRFCVQQQIGRGVKNASTMPLFGPSFEVHTSHWKGMWWQTHITRDGPLADVVEYRRVMGDTMVVTTMVAPDSPSPSTSPSTSQSTRASTPCIVKCVRRARNPNPNPTLTPTPTPTPSSQSMGRNRSETEMLCPWKPPHATGNSAVLSR